MAILSPHEESDPDEPRCTTILVGGHRSSRTAMIAFAPSEPCEPHGSQGLRRHRFNWPLCCGELPVPCSCVARALPLLSAGSCSLRSSPTRRGAPADLPAPPHTLRSETPRTRP